MDRARGGPREGWAGATEATSPTLEGDGEIQRVLASLANTPHSTLGRRALRSKSPSAVGASGRHVRLLTSTSPTPSVLFPTLLYNDGPCAEFGMRGRSR